LYYRYKGPNLGSGAGFLTSGVRQMNLHKLFFFILTLTMLLFFTVAIAVTLHKSIQNLAHQQAIGAKK
jgi:hypothetical protein